MDSGCGWLLTIIDRFAWEYKWDERKILTTPLAKLFALLVAANCRRGQSPSGPSYEMQDRLDAIHHARPV